MPCHLNMNGDEIGVGSQQSKAERLAAFACLSWYGLGALHCTGNGRERGGDSLTDWRIVMKKRTVLGNLIMPARGLLLKAGLS